MKITGTDIGRRRALKLLAAAMAAPMSACKPPAKKIIPYAEMPEGLVAGEPMRFATTLSLSGYARGVLGISVDGRPIKIEGNPRHPFSLGATDLFAEAEVLSLYDQDRSRHIRAKGAVASRDDFMAAWRAAMAPGTRLGVVTGRILAPAAIARIDALRRRFPDLRWYRYEPVNDDAARAGARLAFDRVVTPSVRWDELDVILALDADPLGHGPDQLRIARAHASRRGSERRQRVHVVEPAWSLTGAAADFRLALRPEAVAEIARVVAGKLGAEMGEPALDERSLGFAQRVAAELAGARGRAAVLAGERQSPALHALCHWINTELKAPVSYLASLDPVESDHGDELKALAGDLHDRRIDALIIADVNPVYDAPDALGISEALRNTPFSAHLGLYVDETAACCAWHVPLSHALESWGDGRAPDGTSSFVQPLIRNLYDTQTRDEFLSMLDEPGTAYDLVRTAWRPRASGDFEAWWRQALHDGVVADSAATPADISVRRRTDLPPLQPAASLTLVLSPDPSVWDGRAANNPWLQECPKPFTKEVWGNAVQLAPRDAERLGVSNAGAIELVLGGHTHAASVTVLAGQAEGVIAAHWGYGRWLAGRIGTAIGIRYAGLGTEPFARLLPVADTRRGGDATLRSTQFHTQLSGPTEELFQVTTPGELQHGHRPDDVPPASLLAIPARGEYAWAMVIDTDLCIGCNACVVACQAENNVPVVGPEEITQGRDMHWLRVDAYAYGDGNDASYGFQPVPCMHCELAPCEPVCPVEASVHDHQGLNVQVYNRCIGTRFCEANCPYKVRRFNYFAYAGAQAFADDGAALKAQHNPDVSARGRGVMEKCNYCLQRVNRARRNAEKADRKVADGEMMTACQVACPTRAINFGDLTDDASHVSELRQSPRHYALLAELNTRPRTTYLKRIRVSGDPEP